MSLFLSPLSIFLCDKRGTMIASTTKGPAACVWMRISFLLSFLLHLYLFLLTPSDLPYSLLTPTPSSLFPAPLSLPAWCHSTALLLHSSLGPWQYNQGMELKIRKCPCRGDTRMVHFDVSSKIWNSYVVTLDFSLLLSLSSALSPLLFLRLLLHHQVPSCTIQLERANQGKQKNVKSIVKGFPKTLSFIFYVFT